MRFAYLAVLVASIMACGCAVAQDKPIAVDEGFYLPAGAAERMRLMAAKGDPEAAFRLSLHYSSGNSASAEDARFWRQIAAENGHAVAQYSIWFFDHESEDEFLRARALFWLERSAEAGFEGAKKQLSR